MTSAQSYTRTGSSPAVSGNLSILAILEDTADQYVDALAESLSAVVSEESEYLKSQLSRHPDWADKVDSTNVSYRNGKLEYSVSHPDAVDLEYGNPTKKVVATGTLRSVAKSREYDTKESLMRHLSSRLPSA